MKISEVIISLNKFDDEYLAGLKQEFYNLDENMRFYVQGQIHMCEWEKDLHYWHVEYLKYDDYITEKIDFLKYFNNHIDGLTSLIDDSLILVHLNYELKNFNALVNSLIKQLELLLYKKPITELAYFNVFGKKISELVRMIAGKYLDNYSPEPSKFNFEPKIKYLGSINMLSTFFLKYSEPNNNLKKPIFERDVKAFKNLMSMCFIDSNGEKFSEATLTTYFNDSRSKEKWNGSLELVEIAPIIDNIDPKEVVKGSD